jgi:hypothetical protein
MKTSRTGFLISAASVFAISAYAGVTHAFPEHREWVIPASGGSGPTGRRPGAEGVFYTGGLVDSKLRCSSCHIDNRKLQGKISVEIDTKPAWRDQDGERGYEPGRTYDVTVRMIGEHRGDGTDNNGMTLTIEDREGATAGVFIADVGGRSDSEACLLSGAENPLLVEPTQTQTTAILADCRAVVSIARARDEQPRTRWHFKWIAPAAGTGDVVIYLGTVDGDAQSSSSLGDDVAEGAVLIREAL